MCEGGEGGGGGGDRIKAVRNRVYLKAVADDKKLIILPLFN